MEKQNAPTLSGEGVACKLGGYIDAYATEVRTLQQFCARLPILSNHFGLDALATFEESARA